MTDVRNYWSIFVDPDIPLGERLGLAVLFPVLAPLSLVGCGDATEPDTEWTLPEPLPPLPDALLHNDSVDAATRPDTYCPPVECPGVVVTAPSALPRCLAFAETQEAMGLVASGVHSGIALIDLNQDGWPDVYVLRADGPNQLYVNDAGKGFLESAAQYGLALTGPHRALSWGDDDSDGDDDLLLVGDSGSQLYRRDDDTFVSVALVDPTPATAVAWIAGGWLLATTEGTRFYHPLGGDLFADLTDTSGLWDPAEGSALAIADYDGDGFDDLFLANVTGPNRLFRNRGDETFVAVEDAAGVTGNPLTASMAARWIMWPGDALPSLYVANWDSANVFYRTNGDGTFTDQAELFGLRDPGDTVIAAWAEPFGLGLPSLFLGRWGQQNLFYVGNTTPLTDFSIPLGMALVDQTVAAAWFDYDHDGRPDLLVATTHALHLHHNETREVTLCR